MMMRGETSKARKKLLRVVNTNKTNDINTKHILRLESKLDSKLGYPQTLAIDILSGVVFHALLHVSASSFNAASQHWSHTVAPIPVTTAATAPLFPDYKTLCNNNINNPGGDAVVDDDIVSQSSPEKKPNKNSGDYDVYDNNPPRSKKPRSAACRPTSSTINFWQGADSGETESEAIAQMKEMIYRAAAFRPVSFVDEAVVEKPKRKNVSISSDPQTVAARQRREKISERIRFLQKLVLGGSKMDTTSMLDEVANYLKFLRSQVFGLD